MNAKVLEASNKQTPTDNKPSSSLANATKEELIEVLQRMNKKVKALSALRTQLTEKAQEAEKERDKLVVLLTEHVLAGVEIAELGEGKPKVEQLQELWEKKDQQNK